MGSFLYTMAAIDLSQEAAIIIISMVVAAVFLILMCSVIFFCFYMKKKRNGNMSHSRLIEKDENNCANQEFYDNLPFKGYKKPPSKIIYRDSCDYADCDYADYADGPLRYHATSKIQAENKKTQEEEKEL